MINYNNLWKLLIDKGLKKKDLREMTGLASSTIAKLTNNQNVNTEVLCRICEVLDCDFKDIISYKKGAK